MTDQPPQGPDDTPGLSTEDFRRHGKALIDWIADYWEEVEGMHIAPSVQPGDVRGKLPPAAPEEPEPFGRLIADLDDIVKPGLTHWQSPNWFAYFPANGSLPGILGELVSAGLGQQGMLWSTSPACTEVESHMADWLVDLLGLPQTWKTTGPGGGVIQGSASDATHTALVVARHLKSKEHSLDDLVAYSSQQAHSSIEKGANVAGFRHYRTVDVDADWAMRPEALEAAIEKDLAAGRVPAFVCSAVGTTGTTAVDPVRAIGNIAQKYGLWHHVDAAYAGSAMLCPELRHHQEGLELADSYVFNPHKWMMVNFDCSLFYVADRRPLIQTLSVLPPYLKDKASDSGQVIDYRDWHVPLGRRFRALKLWWVLRSYGASNLRRMIRDHVGWAQKLSRKIDAHPRLECVAPTPFALVSFRHLDGNETTEGLAASLNARGDIYLTPSKLEDLAFIRISIGQTQTQESHVDALWQTIQELA